MKINNSLNWKIQKVPLAVDAKKITSYCNIVRSDTGTVLGCCPGNQDVWQNHEIFERLVKVFDSEDIMSGLVDKHGRHVFFSTPHDGIMCAGENNLEMHSMIVHHHDGRALPFQLICSLKDEHLTINIPIESRKDIAAGKGVMAIMQQGVNSIKTDLHYFQEHWMSTKEINGYIEFLMNPKRKSTLSQRKVNSIDRLNGIMSTSDKDKTAWDVFKATVTYANNVKSSKDRDASNVIGDSALMVHRAYKYIKTMHLDTGI